MKLAPNVKKQPRGIKHKETEVIIFAGSDAWAHAKQWQEQDGPASGDNVPPVWLGPNQLAELDALKIVPDGKKRVRLYQAGELDLVEIKKIGQKLAAAGVQDANFYPEGMHHHERQNWRRYLSAECENIAAGLTMPEQKKHNFHRWQTVNGHSFLLPALMVSASMPKVKSFTYGAAGYGVRSAQWNLAAKWWRSIQSTGPLSASA